MNKNVRTFTKQGIQVANKHGRLCTSLANMEIKTESTGKYYVFPPDCYTEESQQCKMLELLQTSD